MAMGRRRLVTVAPGKVRSFVQTGPERNGIIPGYVRWQGEWIDGKLVAGTFVAKGKRRLKRIEYPRRRRTVTKVIHDLSTF
jgi:hypothetical protein